MELIEAAKQAQFSEEEIEKIREIYDSVESELTEGNMPETPMEFVDMIKAFYGKARKAKLSRFDLRWGKWSRIMNTELRSKIENDHPNSESFKYVIIYWTLKSEILELHYKYPYYKQSKKRKLEKEAIQIRKFIEEDNPPPLNAEKVKETILRGMR